MKNGTTRFAVLGILSLRPMSGYEIKQAYQRGLVNFWSVSYGQIYPLLRELTEERLVSRSGRSGARDQQRYSLTSKGRMELARWIQRAPAELPRRNELLLKIFFGTPADAALLRQHIAKSLKDEKQRLEQYAVTRDWLEKEHARNPRRPFWALTLQFGQAVAEARLKWAEGALKSLKKEVEQ
jgi:PadR family transcriptional regulator AphA